MTPDEHARLASLLATDGAAVDAYLRSLHAKYHDQPRAHVGVHRAWIRANVTRRRYLGAAFHAFAGYVVAAPASLLQRHTGLVVPAFDAKRAKPL
jgi:hypothetical protein